MPINKDSIFYVAGKQAFQEGVHLADKPAQYLTDEWEKGWLDEMAKTVRELAKK